MYMKPMTLGTHRFFFLFTPNKARVDKSQADLKRDKNSSQLYTYMTMISIACKSDVPTM